jgi:hypothetical protein
MLGISDCGKAANGQRSDVLALEHMSGVASGTKSDFACILSVVLVDGHHRIFFSHALLLA